MSIFYNHTIKLEAVSDKPLIVVKKRPAGSRKIAETANAKIYKKGGKEYYLSTSED